MAIPKFNKYYPSLQDLDKEQKDFYYELVKHLDRGDYLEIEGNISYVFLYLYGKIEKLLKFGFEDISNYLIYLSELYYQEDKLQEYCLRWSHDCLLGLKKFHEYLDKTEPTKIYGHDSEYSNLRLNIQFKVGEEAGANDLLLLVGGRRTNFIESNSGIYKDKILEVFSDYAKQKGGWFKLFKKWGCHQPSYDHYLFFSIPFSDRSLRPILDFKLAEFYTAYDQLSIVDELSREAENLARDEVGVPRIGQGWVSETELYNLLAGEFKSTKVIQHGSPQWLGRQHFDIWFPNWKIAVEYHGKQHFEPIDFFGGKEAYEKTIIRDNRKIKLAKEHHVLLFIVTEEDNQDQLIQEIYKIAENRKILPPK